MKQLKHIPHDSHDVFIPEGMMRVVNTPAVMRSTVEHGWVLAVVANQGTMAGLAHITFGSLESQQTTRRIISQLRRFLSAVTDALPQGSTGRAHLVGGADLLGHFPRAKHKWHCDQIQQLVEELCQEYGIVVEGTNLGGACSRLIRADSAGRQIRTSFKHRPDQAHSSPPSAASIAQPAIITVNMGCVHVDHSPTVLSAILGSCVGIALYDPATHIGGLAHAMMPNHSDQTDNRCKYVDSALDELLRQMKKQGASPKRLQAKIAGGAKVLATEPGSVLGHVAEKNIDRAIEVLDERGVEVLAKAVGGSSGRKIWVDLQTFKMRVRLLGGR